MITEMILPATRNIGLSVSSMWVSDGTWNGSQDIVQIATGNSRQRHSRLYHIWEEQLHCLELGFLGTITYHRVKQKGF